ncbi:MAG: bifunctional folylpolyglutamate synthase/dihydrofolate synthase [Candidatus Eisenbacteria bacterium]|nr:bifunctional folylpolyglutamate synthase/dihydrofolate synthase [Candidatus Eisenbacteria bacterium]
MPDPRLGRLFRLERRGYLWGLRGIRALLTWCGRPERRYATVLVGGTNGKGSTAAALDRILREAGFRTGLYTSPHLVDFRERVRVDGRCMPAERLGALLRRFVPRGEHHGHSFFEVATAMALRHFADARVEIAVLEVGLGGRLDSTNAVSPEVSVLTGASLEHTEYLGDTLEEIAWEKAAIARRARPVVTGGRARARDLLEAAAAARGARVVRARRAARLSVRSMGLEGMELELPSGARLSTPLIGRHQVSNLECAAAAALQLRARGFAVDPLHVARGLAATRWPARFEWLARRRVLLDVAHNPEAAAAFARTWREVMPRRGVGVLGMLADKDARAVARALRPCARRLVVTAPDTVRAMPAERLSRAVGRVPHSVVPGVAAAVRAALQERRPGEPVFVTGSLYTVGEAMRALGHHVADRL